MRAGDRGRWRTVATNLAIVVATVLFGAVDQYLGTEHVTRVVGVWTVSVSLMSAPWLIVPFLAGTTQPRASRAAVVGVVGTFGALAGYFAMTLSPLEGVHVTFAEVLNLVRSNQINLIGGLLTGPLFGWLGYRWRTKEWWPAGGVVVLALCLEPIATVVVGRSQGRSALVAILEVATGALAGLGLWLSTRRRVGTRVDHARRPAH